MKNTIFAILILSTCALAQHKYEITGASKLYDVSFEVAECDSEYCHGDLKVWLAKKGQTKAVHTFALETEFRFYDQELRNEKVIPYDNQGVIDLADYDFDGVDDLAIQNGMESGYGGGSYNIYLYSVQSKKFVFSRSFSALATAPFMGMFNVNKKKRVLETFSKSGCCWHEDREYRVVNGRPVKVYQQTEDAYTSQKWVTTTTLRLVGRKWRTTVKRERKKNVE